MDETFEDLKASLVWGAELPLTDEQRLELRQLCCTIGGCIPRPVLVAERKKRQEAEQRVGELESALKAGRNEWIFRRKPSLKTSAL